MLEYHLSWERGRKVSTDSSNISHLGNKIINPQGEGLQLYNIRILRFINCTCGKGIEWRRGLCFDERQDYLQGPKLICKSMCFPNTSLILTSGKPLSLSPYKQALSKIGFGKNWNNCQKKALFEEQPEEEDVSKVKQGEKKKKKNIYS